MGEKQIAARYRQVQRLLGAMRTVISEAHETYSRIGDAVNLLREDGHHLGEMAVQSHRDMHTAAKNLDTVVRGLATRNKEQAEINAAMMARMDERNGQAAEVLNHIRAASLAYERMALTVGKRDMGTSRDFRADAIEAAARRYIETVDRAQKSAEHTIDGRTHPFALGHLAEDLSQLRAAVARAHEHNISLPLTLKAAEDVAREAVAFIKAEENAGQAWLREATAAQEGAYRAALTALRAAVTRYERAKSVTATIRVNVGSITRDTAGGAMTAEQYANLTRQGMMGGNAAPSTENLTEPPPRYTWDFRHNGYVVNLNGVPVYNPDTEDDAIGICTAWNAGKMWHGPKFSLPPQPYDGPTGTA